MQKQYPNRDVRVAIKRNPDRELTPDEKAYNRMLSRIRIRVEHTIRRIKIFRVMCGCVPQVNTHNLFTDQKI